MNTYADFCRNSIMMLFNEACLKIADDFPTIAGELFDSDTNQLLVTLPFGIDIHEWWMIEGKLGNYYNHHLNTLSKEKKRDENAYLQDIEKREESFREDNPNMAGHYDVMKNSEWRRELKAAKFLPHMADYAMPEFAKCDGLQRLNTICQQLEDVRLDIILGVNDKAESLFADDAYQLVVIFTANDGESLLKKLDNLPKPKKPQLN